MSMVKACLKGHLDPHRFIEIATKTGVNPSAWLPEAMAAKIEANTDYETAYANFVLASSSMRTAQGKICYRGDDHTDNYEVPRLYRLEERVRIAERVLVLAELKQQTANELHRVLVGFGSGVTGGAEELGPTGDQHLVKPPGTLRLQKELPECVAMRPSWLIGTVAEEKVGDLREKCSRLRTSGVPEVVIRDLIRDERWALIAIRWRGIGWSVIRWLGTVFGVAAIQAWIQARTSSGS